MERQVGRELLDELDRKDPGARHSRKDLRRLNAVMGHAATLAFALKRSCADARPASIVELGAGDGTLLLKVARKLGWRGIKTVLVDRQRLVRQSTLEAFAGLGWIVETVQADVFDWLAADMPRKEHTVVVANLFLHHFSDPQLADMFLLAARKARAFVAAEPRRCRMGLVFSRMTGLIGCNAITRHDAALSVRAGFNGTELSRLWPAPEEWITEERPTGWFSHLFAARFGGPGE
jgi:hypothetical protein